VTAILVAHSGRPLTLHLHLLNGVVVASGKEAAGGHLGSSRRGAGVRASDSRADCQPRQDGATFSECERRSASRAVFRPHPGFEQASDFIGRALRKTAGIKFK
jgi:hypothetical protein